jgi:hypothetical protein
MERQARKCSNNWMITVEGRNDQRQEIILSTIAKRAYQLFERRGCADALTWRTGLLPRRNFCRTTLMGIPRDLTSLLSLREIRR